VSSCKLAIAIFSLFEFGNEGVHTNMERRESSTGRGKGKARVGSGGQGRGRGSSDEQTSQPILTSHPTIPHEISVSTVQSPEMDMEGMATSTPTPTRLPEPKISNLSVPKETRPESSRARSAPVHIPPPNKPNGEGMTYSFQFGSVAPVFETKLEYGLFRLYRLEGGGKNFLGSSKKPDGGGTNDLVPVNRPDKGNNSTRLVPVNLLANHFPVSFNASQIILHYDLDIKKANGNVTIKNREECVKIKKGLHRTIYNHATIVHDGKRNMYSIENLEPGKKSASKVYTVTVKYMNSKDGGSLSKFLDIKNQHHVNFKNLQDCPANSICKGYFGGRFSASNNNHPNDGKPWRNPLQLQGSSSPLVQAIGSSSSSLQSWQTHSAAAEFQKTKCFIFPRTQRV
jgi:hypothetical protein